jgi:hypothetical protein
MNPLELLQARLASLKKDLQKAEEVFNRKAISKDRYELYKENITPNIQEYKDAVETLKIFGK